jgi:hypothetical protein
MGALKWRKSSRSNGSSGNCVEVALCPDGVAMRDSKNPDGPMLIIGRESWKVFIEATKSGEFDLV